MRRGDPVLGKTAELDSDQSEFYTNKGKALKNLAYPNVSIVSTTDRTCMAAGQKRGYVLGI